MMDSVDAQMQTDSNLFLKKPIQEERQDTTFGHGQLLKSLRPLIRLILLSRVIMIREFIQQLPISHQALDTPKSNDASDRCQFPLRNARIVYGRAVSTALINDSDLSSPTTILA